MLALRWHGRGDVRLDEIEAPPPPGPGEVQLRVLACGICGTDVEEYRSGPIFIPSGAPHPLTGRSAPITLGHEFSGEVVAVGPGVGLYQPGDRVAADTLIFCGECFWCRRHQVTLCERLGALGLMADGGLAEGKLIANLAEPDYIPFAPHNVSSPVGTIAAAHVCAAVSNFSVLEWHAIDMPHRADFVRYSGGEIIREGHIELTEVTGLGLELDEELALAHRHEKGGVPFFGRG